MTTRRDEWTARSNYVKFGPDDGMEHAGHADVFTVNPKDRERFIRRIAAVPDLEAALMDAHKDVGCICKAGDEWRCHIAQALRKAGRIP